MHLNAEHPEILELSGCNVERGNLKVEHLSPNVEQNTIKVERIPLKVESPLLHTKKRVKSHLHFLHASTFIRSLHRYPCLSLSIM